MCGGGEGGGGGGGREEGAAPGTASNPRAACPALRRTSSRALFQPPAGASLRPQSFSSPPEPFIPPPPPRHFPYKSSPRCAPGVPSDPSPKVAAGPAPQALPKAPLSTRAAPSHTAAACPQLSGPCLLRGFFHSPPGAVRLPSVCSTGTGWLFPPG